MLPAVLLFEVLREVDGADRVFQVDVLGQFQHGVVDVRVVVLEDDGRVLQAGFFPAEDEAVLVLGDEGVGHVAVAVLLEDLEGVIEGHVILPGFVAFGRDGVDAFYAGAIPKDAAGFGRVLLELFEMFGDFTEVFWQAVQGFFFELLRYIAIEGFRDGTGHTGLRVCIATEGDRFADGVLVGVGLEECEDGFRDGALAGDVELVGRADVIEGTVKVIAERVREVLLDEVLVVAGAGKVDARGDGLRALDTFRVVVGDLGSQLRHVQRVAEGRVEPAHRGHAHAGAVAVAAIGFRVVFVQPVVERAAVAGVVVLAAEALHLVHDGAADGVIVLAVRVHEGLRNGQSHDRVVRRTGVLVEQLEVVVFRGVEFVVGSYDVPKDST